MLVRIYTIEFSKNYLEIGTALLSLYALQPDTIKELKKRSVFARGTLSGLCFLKGKWQQKILLSHLKETLKQ